MKSKKPKSTSNPSSTTKTLLLGQIALLEKKVSRLGKTAQKTAVHMKEYKDLQARFAAIISSTNEAIIMIDDDGVTNFWNQTAERMFGFTAEEVLGRPVSKFIIPPQYVDRHNTGVAKFKKTTRAKSFGRTIELSALRKNGEEFPMEISYYSSPIQMNGRWHAVAIIRDITSRKIIETEIRRVKDELQNEHKEAENIGKSLLKDKPLAGRMKASIKIEPCSTAGGDRAGFITRAWAGDAKIEEWLVVFDASGHGKGAAKFQEVAIGGLLTLVDNGANMEDALKAVNRTLEKIGTGRFLVGNVFRLMRKEQKDAGNAFVYVEEFNIGQHGILALDPGESEAVDWEWNKKDGAEASLPIGLFDDGLENLKPHYRKVKNGTRIVAFTDGITEAVNPDGKQFGRERLRSLIAQSRNLSPEQSHSAVVRAVKRWVANAPEGTPDDLLNTVQMNDDIGLAIVDVI